jgi:hypothetical protein
MTNVGRGRSFSRYWASESICLQFVGYFKRFRIARIRGQASVGLVILRVNPRLAACQEDRNVKLLDKQLPLLRKRLRGLKLHFLGRSSFCRTIFPGKVSRSGNLFFRFLRRLPHQNDGNFCGD